MALRLPFSVRDELQDFVRVRNLARFPQFLSLDLELAKKFKIIKKYGLRLSVVASISLIISIRTMCDPT